MIRFFQRFRYCISPSTDNFTAEDYRKFVSGREGLNSNTKEHPDLPIQPLSSKSRDVQQSIGTTFQDAHHFNISGNSRIVNIGQQHVNTNRGTCGLDILKEFVSFNALHDSSAQDPERCCHPGTRKNVLAKICTWMDDPDASERILWLYGPAGVGKSAIAQTISYSYGRDKVGATFFFFRSDPFQNDGNRLVPTLAWQLALSVPIVEGAIARSLEDYPDLPRKTIEAQFDKLIVQSFLAGESVVPTYIIIDGLDECSDMKLQQRILKIIGSAVSDLRFPLRFIISSRPEAHIEDFFSQFQHSTLQIDLANVDGAYRDIDAYLTSEFTRIAVKQGLDPEVWPGQAIISNLVSQSSGQFIYASTVIKYVDDEYESAISRLKVILGLKPSAGQSPFSELDALYMEILQRQPDKKFLKDFFAVLVASRSLSPKGLHKDDAMLLGLDEQELHWKLRGMHSLLKSKPFIDVHHKSFFDFLYNPSRSGEYHISKHFANRRYMELITDALVRSASKAMKQPDSHEGGHFNPEFANIANNLPLGIELSLRDLEEILQPLQIIQDNLLQLPNMSLPWKPRACDECWTFYMIDVLLLHLTWLRGTTQLQESRYVGIRPLTAMEKNQDIPQLDLDTCLSLLLANLRGVESQLPLNIEMIGLMRALVSFDPTEAAMKVQSITDAQNLVELIFSLNKNQCFNSWFGVEAHNATWLALAIYGRVPLLPRSLFLKSADFNGIEETYQGKAVNIWVLNTSFRQNCFDVFLWGSLSHGNIEPLLGICSFRSGMVEVFALQENSVVGDWWRSSNPSVSKIQQIFFEIAKAIQYIHSLGIILGYHFDEDDIYLDSDSHVKMHWQCPVFCSNGLCKGEFDYKGYDDNYALKADISLFGHLFYEILFNESYDEVRPREPEIHDNVWELIQWCCSKDSKERPTMDQVVQEMESWISVGQFTLSS